MPIKAFWKDADMEVFSYIILFILALVGWWLVFFVLGITKNIILFILSFLTNHIVLTILLALAGIGYFYGMG